VSVINTATQKVTDTIPLGSFTYADAKTSFSQPNQIPTGIALAPDNRYMWVACNVSGSMAIIDTTTNAVTTTAQIGLGDEPTTIAFAS
jgi:YVTN family beta-propeller protein